MEGEYCNIDIDATEAVARVAFRDTVQLGVLYNRYELGNFITIPEGEKQTITIYNGKEKGPIAYFLSFSGSSMLQLGTALALIGGTYM